MSRFQVLTSMTPPVPTLALLHCPAATAAVIAADASGFTTRQSVTVSRSRAAVYQAATARIGSWWSDDHTVSGRAANMYLEPRVQGCFCEKLGEQGGVVHMLVTFVNPTVMLRLSGGLGPLGLMGVSGNMTWEFTDSADGTTMTWSYAVGGYFPGCLDQISSAVDV